MRVKINNNTPNNAIINTAWGEGRTMIAQTGDVTPDIEKSKTGYCRPSFYPTASLCVLMRFNSTKKRKELVLSQMKENHLFLYTGNVTIYLYIHTCSLGVAWWLRHCATSRRVSGSIPRCVAGDFFQSYRRNYVP